jgi:hypothetical protein
MSTARSATITPLRWPQRLGRAALLLLGMSSLVTGIWGGLLRVPIAVPLPVEHANWISFHGPGNPRSDCFPIHTLYSLVTALGLCIIVPCMKSPFPGMDPYLERHWEDVHHRLVQYASDTLQPDLPDDLLARVEERVFVESSGARIRPIAPDVRIVTAYPAPGDSGSSKLREDATALIEPLVFELDELEVTEGYIKILEGNDGKVITVIEFLSPSNKRRGAGQDQYLNKQAELLGSDTSLVEIDLVRSGRRVLALPADQIPTPHRNDYLTCVSPGWNRVRRELYPMPLRQRLPVLPIPLRRHEPPLGLDLQSLIDQAYAAGRYHKLDYRIDLDPPLVSEDAAWAAELLQAAGKR